MYYRTINGGNSIASLYQIFSPGITSTTTVMTVTISMIGVSGTPTTYSVTYQKMLNETTTDGGEVTQTSASNGIVISGLTSNALYKVTTKLSNSSGEGNQMQVFHRLSSNPDSPSKTGSPKEIGEKVTAKSFLTIKGGETRDNEYTYAYKNFDAIQLPTSTTSSFGEGSYSRPVKNYTESYYAFGTSVIFEPLIKYKPQGAAIGLFFDESNVSGYFISLETSATAASANSSPLKIFKLDKKRIIKLTDSQKGNRATLDQLFAGTVYNVDVKIKIVNKTITIIAYVNGFRVEASDTTISQSDKTILDPTNKIALVGLSGTSKFDYVYGESINAELYDRNYQSLNFYNGQFTKDFLDLSYGDMLYNASSQDVDMTTKQNAFDEFGTVVREISRKKVRFGSAPSIPIRWTTGGNKLAKIIGQSYDNFKADVLVLNNTSITIPLSDKGVNQLSIYGNTIGFSGEIEYNTSPVNEYASSEPVIFESVWLQNQKDVKSLADWIQGRIVNKANIITMKVFGNPLISIGDVITINYPYQGLTSTQKIIVVKVNQSFQGGLSTEIVGRTL